MTGSNGKKSGSKPKKAATPNATSPTGKPLAAPSDPQSITLEARSNKKKSDIKQQPSGRKKKSDEKHEKKKSARALGRKEAKAQVSKRFIDAPSGAKKSSTSEPKSGTKQSPKSDRPPLSAKPSDDCLEKRQFMRTAKEHRETKAMKTAKEKKAAPPSDDFPTADLITPPKTPKGKKSAPPDDFFPAADLVPASPPPKGTKDRPLNDTSLRILSDRVKQMRKRSQEQAEKKIKVKPGDCPFPKYINLKTTEEPTKHSQYVPITGLDSQRISTEAWLVRATKKIKNNDNNGRVLVKDSRGKERPFWLSDSLYRPQITDDEFILNAETLGDVLEGKVLLDGPAPDWTTKCNVVGKLTTLQDKDQAAFRNPTIYRNSVRSMIEITETPRPKPEETEYTPVDMPFNQPTEVHLYDRENLLRTQTAPYVPGEWKIQHDSGKVIRVDGTGTGSDGSPSPDPDTKNPPSDGIAEEQKQ